MRIRPDPVTRSMFPTPATGSGRSSPGLRSQSERDLEREAPTALKLAARVFIRRGYGRRCLFPQIRSQKRLPLSRRYQTTGLHAFEYLAPHFTALVVGRIDIEVPVPGH
jgi:hypothetical protein